MNAFKRAVAMPVRDPNASADILLPADALPTMSPNVSSRPMTMRMPVGAPFSKRMTKFEKTGITSRGPNDRTDPRMGGVRRTVGLHRRTGDDVYPGGRGDPRSDHRRVSARYRNAEHRRCASAARFR